MARKMSINALAFLSSLALFSFCMSKAVKNYYICCQRLCIDGRVSSNAQLLNLLADGGLLCVMRWAVGEPDELFVVRDSI